MRTLRPVALLALLGPGCATPLPATPAPTVAQVAAVAGDELLAVVPTAAEVLLLIDLAQLRASPWTRDVLRSPAVAGQAAARVAARGFDELVDVDQMVMVAAPGSGTADGNMTTGLLVMQGRLDVGHAIEAATRRWPGAQTSTFRGRPLVSSGEQAVAFATDRIFVSGPLSAVRAAIDCAAGKGADMRRADWLADLRREMIDGHGRRSGRPALELAVAISPEIRQRMTQELGDAADLRTFGARLDLQSSLDVAFVGATGTRGGAVDLAARLEEQVHQLRTRRSLAALGLDLIMEQLHVSTHGARLEGSLSVSESQRDVVSEKVKAFADEVMAAVPAQAPSVSEGTREPK